MPFYKAVYTLSNGREVTQRMQSATAELLRAELRLRGYFPLEVSEVEAGSRQRRLRIKPRTLARLLRQLAMQIRAGVNEIDAVAKLKDSHPDTHVRFFLSTVHASLTTAKESFGDALSSFPRVLPPHLRAIIRAAEGNGPEATANAMLFVRDWLLFVHRMRKTIFRATRYPAFLGLLVINFLCVFVGFFVPRFQLLLNEYNAKLPKYTLFIIGVSHFLAESWYFIVAAMILGIAGFITARRFETSALVIDRVALRIPVYSRIYQYLATAQITKNMRGILASGVNAIDALEQCELMITNRAARGEIRHMVREMRQGGATLATAFARSGYFPPEAVSIIETGETTGNLNESLADVAEEYEGIARESVEEGLAFLQPVLLVTAAVIVFAVILAMIIPFANLYESM